MLVGKVGAKITSVKPGSPLRSVASEDIILAVNGKIVHRIEDITQNCIRKLVILKSVLNVNSKRT